MNIFQRLLYTTLTVAVACAVSVANIVFYDATDRIPDTSRTDEFIADTDSVTDSVLKDLFPYEEQPVYTLEVPSNMSYTAAEFQKFKGTYLEEVSSPAASASYLPKCLFCGDSLTYHMGTISGAPLLNYNTVAFVGASVFDYATNTSYAHYNQSSSKGVTTLSWIKQIKANVIYVMLGTNGVAVTPNESHINQYRKLLTQIKAASPNATIVICSIPPWGTKAFGTYTTLPIATINQKIDTYNMYLLELAKETGCYYLNVALAYKDSTGKLIDSYTVGDGLHVTNAARKAHMQYLLSHPVPGM